MPTVGIKRKHLKLTSQTKWNWSIKHFYIVYKLANKPFTTRRRKSKSALALVQVRIVTNKFDIEPNKGLFRRVS